MKKHRTLWIALVFLLTAVGALSAAASNAEVEDARDQVEQAEAKAKDILRYREQHGKFTDIEELMEIPGIKAGVFQKIKDQITI